MNNVNTLNDTSVNPKKSSGLGRLSQVLALCTILSVANPTEVNANNSMDGSMQNMEMVQNYDIINNIQRRTGVTLPSVYAQKFNNFVLNSRILRDKDAQKFTEDFIVKQMQSNRGISKQNQLLFIWDAVYEQITGKNIYTGEDGNNKRLAEFENVMDIVEQCGKNYNSGFKTYMRQQSADARQQSADARQQSADARQQSADARQQSADARQQSADARQQSADARQQSADARQQSADARQQSIELTYKGLEQISNYYHLCKRNPNLVNENELIETKKYAKHVIQNCKKYGINYKAKLSPEIRRFYGID